MLDQFREHLVLEDRSDITIKGYLRDLRQFSRWFKQTNREDLSPSTLTPIDVRSYKSHMQTVKKCKPNTINRHLAALRAYGAWAEEAGLVDINPARKTTNVPQTQLAPRWLDHKEQLAIERELAKGVQNASTEPARFNAVRDHAMVTLLLHTGLRLAELCALELDDLVVKQRTGHLTVRQGKGNKMRVIPLNKNARSALEEWMKVRDEAASASRLFLSRSGAPIASRTISHVLQELASATVTEVTSQVLRHTFAKNLVDSGVGLEKVAALLGHSSLNTTKVYITPSLEDLNNAVARLED